MTTPPLLRKRNPRKRMKNQKKGNALRDMNGEPTMTNSRNIVTNVNFGMIVLMPLNNQNPN
jgi:hypothetical protein